LYSGFNTLFKRPEAPSPKGGFLGIKPLSTNKTTRQKMLFVYLSLLPILGLYSVLRIIPIAQNFYYSFFSSTIAKPAAVFIGLANYKDLLADNLFQVAIRNTSYFALFVTVFGVILSLFVALMLNKTSRMSPFYEAVYFLPVITPMVPVAVVWKWIYDPTYGLLNYALSWFSVPPVAWLVYPNTAMMAIIIMSVWKLIGYNMIIFLVGLRNISTTYIEAARIDGACAFQQFFKITLPLLRPVILLTTIMSTNGTLQLLTK
jgi:multiple sugar transport system permease protein